MTLLALLAALLQASPPSPAPRIASDLRVGMQLVYGSQGQSQPPWIVEAVQAAAPLKVGADCARVSIRRQPAPAPPDDARLCVEAGVLHAMDPKTNNWQPQRPIGPNMSLVLARGNAGSVRYETGSTAQATIGSLRLHVVETVVTTLDASGTAIRRLRERYAVSLTTALGGTFEVPDPAVAGGWRAQQVFELVEIRLPQ